MGEVLYPGAPVAPTGFFVQVFAPNGSLSDPEA